MSDIYIPGISSRFNSDRIIDGLMTLERIPRDRVVSNIENLQLQKGYWTSLGTRIRSLNESASALYSFQNPFNERIASSSDNSAITASAARNAAEQTYSFTVKQTAAADRFLSRPLDEKTRIEAGNYIFSVGNDEIAVNFRGGTLQEFVDAVNRRGREKIALSTIAVQSGTRSLLIESKVTGAANRLVLSGDAADLAVSIGMMERANDSQRSFTIADNTVRKSGQNAANVTINDGVLKAPPLSSVSIPLNLSLSADSPVMLRLSTLTRVETSDVFNVVQPPPGPSVPSGSVTYGGITIENEPSAAPLPVWTPPPVPPRNDDMSVLTLVFSDGTSAKLAPITDSSDFTSRTYLLSDIAQGRTIVSLNIENSNTHREVSVGMVEIFDPTAAGGLKPVNAVSSARDAIISMEGIEITRSSNTIDDVIPGLTLNVRGVSEKPVELNVRADIEGVKDAIISFVGNYNRLMAELNVLTATGSSSTRRVRDENGNWVLEVVRNIDDSIVNELTYLTAEESAEMKSRLGAFSGDSTLSSLKNNLRMAVSAPYPTILERDLSMLAQIGISTNADMSVGYSPSRLRGYLQINEKVLDEALETKIPAIRQLFANDTTGDMLMDTGVALNVNTMTQPFVQTGGIITLKTGTIDSRISQDERRITTMDRQLAAKEQELRIQYARMESAYARMEQLTNSLDNFSRQNSNNR